MANTTLPMRSPRQSGTVQRPQSGLSIELLDDYRYSSLVGQDIRLLDLLPGHDDEDVRIRIHHCPLREPPSKEDPRISLTALRETLPRGWHVFKTIEGRYLFGQWSSETAEWTNTTWRHPDPDFDASKYEQVPVAGEDEEDPGHTRFEALSYAWGHPPEEPLYIRVEDSSHNYKLRVWPNLMSALRHLRPRDRGTLRRMWVDAICLNQKDHVEKELHIPRMRDIYRFAYRTVVWLGPQCDVTGLAFRTVEHISSHVELECGNTIEMLPSPGTNQSWYNLESELPSLPAEAWDAFASLLSLSWFSRLWVLQEVQLSNKTGPRETTIHWGLQSIASSKLYKACGLVSARYFRGWPLPQVVNAGRELKLDIVHASNLLFPYVEGQFSTVRRLLREHASRCCVDDRDRVYGLLGLTGVRFSERIKVNYDSTYGAADVYRDALLTHTKLSGRLELLDSHGPSYRKVLADTPSWVPEWSGPADIDCSMEPTFPAQNTRAHIKHNKHDPDVLHVLGVQCAVVNEVTEPLESGVAAHPWQALRDVRGWQPDDLDTAFYTPTGELMREAYAITLIQAEVSDRRPYEYGIESQQWIGQDYIDALFGRKSFAQGTDQASPSTVQTMHHHILRTLHKCANRRLFQTEEGYIGIANRETRKGDIVVIFLGCITPVVIRPVHDTDSQMRFSFVGECFVHGLHDSMKLLGPLPLPWKAIIVPYDGCRFNLRFRNTETGEETWLDPRLPPLEEWEGFWTEVLEQHHPIDPIFLRHRVTGEEITYDPRLEPEYLESRGVDLTWFTLV